MVTTAVVLSIYPKNVHQPWPLALKYSTVQWTSLIRGDTPHVRRARWIEGEKPSSMMGLFCSGELKRGPSVETGRLRRSALMA